MTPEEHKEIYQAVSESIVAKPEVPKKEQNIDPRALRGALHLDEHHPGWAKKINLETFNLDDATKCVVGQVSGYYDSHANRLFPGVGGGYCKKAEDFGIMPNGRNTNALQRSWKILIAERQARSHEQSE